jgi:hypothetical protein
MRLNQHESAPEKAGENVPDAMRKQFHKRIGKVITGATVIGLDTTIGAAKLGTYGVTRAIRGVFEVKEAAQRGIKGERYNQAA